jgi:hypothetical protein
VVAVQRRSGSMTDCSVTASLLVICMWHGWSPAVALTCRLPKRGRQSCRCRAGIAWTDDAECCIPPCSSSNRRNWWST